MRRLILNQVVLVLLALALLPASALAAEAPQPGIVQPPTGTAGTRFVFIGEGFRGGERLSGWANTPDGRVLAYDTGVPDRATSDGSVSWNWVAPADFQGGAWQFVVHGHDSGVERVFGFGIGAAAPAGPAPQEPQFNIQPSVGRPGQLFRFYATGFEEGEPVDTHVYAPDGRDASKGLQVLNYAQGGRIDGNWTAPDNPSGYGAWRIALRGQKSKVERVIPFTLEPAQAANRPAPRVSPAVGRPGMLFIFDAGGFQAGERLSAWVNLPDGKIVGLDEGSLNPATSSGRASWSWTAPANAAPGGYSMVIHGLKSGIEQVVGFTIGA